MTFRDMLNIDCSRLEELKTAELVDDASHNLNCIFTELAGSEALLRALVAERAKDRKRARFWARVYLKCSAPSAA